MNAHQRRKARRANDREPWVMFVPADSNAEWFRALQGTTRNKATWPDFAGHAIYEGDVIEHPSGERGTVVFLAQESDPGDQWRVDYGDGYLSRLCLQIGDKGRAVVLDVPLIRGEIGRIEG